MGKYDLVETVLKDLGAQFFFDAVAIRPGKPAVFGKCRDTFVFGLPGNPVSTMVTFELFVTAAIDLLSGAPPHDLPFVTAKLAAPLREKPGLTHFLPARLEWPKEGVREQVYAEPTRGNAASHVHKAAPQVTPLPWQGSGDIAALAHANCFLVVDADRDQIAAGDPVPILLRKDVT